MIIGDYDVQWVQHGWSYARPTLYERRRFLGVLWNRWERVRNVPPFCVKPYNDAAKMFPDEAREWFQSAVDQYEEYKSAWERLSE